MPIEFSDIGEDDKWAGSDWTVSDPDDLAHHIARVALANTGMLQKFWLRPAQPLPALTKPLLRARESF